ncbi:MAG: 4a-hydroxytetrahydrobiopterin dehydratase [Acidimicrobiales bacterium]
MVLLDDQAITAALAGLGWQREGDELTKVHRSADFAQAMAYVSSVAPLAEAANHHPDIDIRWNTVTLRLSTHSEGGITDADLRMARAIDALG